MVPFRLQETLTIEKLVYGGEGLARLEGKVVLTPFVLPGEVVRAETEETTVVGREGPQRPRTRTPSAPRDAIVCMGVNNPG